MKLIKNLDWQIFLPTLFISILSFITIYGIDSILARDHIIFLGIGLVLFFIISNIDFRIFQSLSYIFFAGSLFILIITFILGQVTRGSVRWIIVGNLSFQASEFIKPLLIVFFSHQATKLDFSKFKQVLFFLIYLILPLLLVFNQPDLGNSLVLLVIWLTVLIAAGLKKSFFLASIVLFIALLPLSIRFLKPYQMQRITAFLNPNYDPLGSGYHIIQSIISVGSGLVFGKGLGMGSQGQLKFLPERHTDFIFATFAEEFGFFGASILIFLYAILFFKLLKVAEKTSSRFGSLVCLGVFAMLFFQTIVNLGMNVGMMPITGITLPLFSSGGSSLVSILISLGIVQNISSNLKNDTGIEIS
jgi:rod shape determining protein RodA